MPTHSPSSVKVVLLSSGLGYVSRGIEIWMTELAPHLISEMDVEVWSGGPAPVVAGCVTHSLHGLSRDARVMHGWSWHRRYQLEQLSILLQTTLRLGRQSVDIVYCGDPVLSWHLKRLRKIHGAKVVFMNGMRLSPNWAKDFDGVHLLAPPYLEAARRDLGNDSSKNFFAVPHFVDLERFQPANEFQRAAARQRLGLQPEDFVVLTVGPIGNVSNKRLEWLAEEVALAGKPCKLVSAGVDEDGAEAVRSHVRTALGNQIQFLGRVDRAQMPTLFHAADVYSLGSLAEPFSIAILEALASGVPVVHHCDEVMQWQSGAGGVPVSMTTRGEAGQAFKELMSNRSRQNELRSAARQLAEQRYSPEAVGRNTAAALLQLCGRELKSNG